MKRSDFRSAPPREPRRARLYNPKSSRPQPLSSRALVRSGSRRVFELGCMLGCGLCDTLVALSRLSHHPPTHVCRSPPPPRAPHPCLALRPLLSTQRPDVPAHAAPRALHSSRRLPAHGTVTPCTSQFTKAQYTDRAVTITPLRQPYGRRTVRHTHTYIQHAPTRTRICGTTLYRECDPVVSNTFTLWGLRTYPPPPLRQL